ncbi:MAG: PaaX family transcriptional regulator [Actinobacteria bacterium]|nr:PaaX family transcriptional regulator [Actinomycetota bacterium]
MSTSAGPVAARDPVVGSLGAAAAVRPQIVLYTVFGDHLVDSGLAVATSSLLDVAARVGIGEHAMRTTLARLTARGTLTRVRRGRQAWIGLSEQGRRTVLDGRARAHSDVVTTDWDGTWTLVAFSLPDSLRRRRYDLRVRLEWAGFGVAQGGLWVCPRDVDVEAVLGEVDLEGLDLHDRVRAFRATTLSPTRVSRMVAEAYPLASLAAGYTAFEQRWAGTLDDPGPVDPLARRALLAADWSRVVRRDPRLPLELLPADWPAARAQTLFRELVGRLTEPSRRQAQVDMDTVRLP